MIDDRVADANAMVERVAGAAAPPPGAYDADICILALDRAEETLAAIRSEEHTSELQSH